MKDKHVHQWKRIATTYAPPGIERMGRLEGASDQTLLILFNGMTTILWECQDPECGERIMEEMIGKEVTSD